MSKFFLIIILYIGLILSPALLFADPQHDCRAYSVTEQNNINLIKSIFMNNVWKTGKNPAAFAKIYAKNFIFYSNGVIEDYEKFKNHMSKNVDYWEWNKVKFNDVFAHCDKVIARIHVRGKSKKGKIYELDSMELFQIKDNQIIRWWEISYPDWRPMVKESGESY